MRDGLLRRDPRLGLRIVEPLQPRVRIVEPPPVQRVAAIRIAARHGEFEGRVQILHQVVEEYRALEPRDLTVYPRTSVRPGVRPSFEAEFHLGSSGRIRKAAGRGLS